MSLSTDAVLPTKDSELVWFSKASQNNAGPGIMSLQGATLSKKGKSSSHQSKPRRESFSVLDESKKNPGFRNSSPLYRRTPSPDVVIKDRLMHQRSKSRTGHMAVKASHMVYKLIEIMQDDQVQLQEKIDCIRNLANLATKHGK